MLEDSLAALMIMTVICSICVALFFAFANQMELEDSFYQENNNAYRQIFSHVYICESCADQDQLP